MSASVIIRKYGYLSLLFVSVLFICFGVYKLGNRLFEIKNIEVAGGGVKVIVDEKRIAKNLLFFPGDSLREQILEDNPLVGDVVFRKKFPHTLVIIAKPRIPVAIINSNSGPMGLDKSSVVLGEAPGDRDLPELLFSVSPVVPGQRVGNPAVLASLSFIIKTQSFLKLAEVESSGSSTLLAKTAKVNILIPQQGDMSALATTLQTLITGFRIKGSLPTKIDLRFDKPIITF